MQDLNEIFSICKIYHNFKIHLFLIRGLFLMLLILLNIIFQIVDAESPRKN